MPKPTLIEQFYAAIKAADAQALAACISDDFALNWQGSPSIPWAGQWRGEDGLMEFFKSLNEHVRVIDINVQAQFENESMTMVLLEGHWNIPATSTDVKAMAANIFRFADGKIAAYEVLNNSAAFADALTAK